MTEPSRPAPAEAEQQQFLRRARRVLLPLFALWAIVLVGLIVLGSRVFAVWFLAGLVLVVVWNVYFFGVYRPRMARRYADGGPTPWTDGKV